MSSLSSSTFRRFKVFSTRKVSLQTTADVDTQPKKYWLVESDAKSALTIRPIDDQTWLPTGRAHPITVRELQKRYTPEPGLYEQRIQPNIERYEGSAPLLAAPEMEQPPVDEAVIIADFQLGMNLLEKGDLEKATTAFSKLLNSEGPFEEKHKHLFNDFAIQLRKNNLHSQAIAYYTRALELSWSDEDENLHINLARVLFSEKQYAGCVQHLFDALRISPGHRVARSFLAWLDQQKVVPKQYALQVKGCLLQKPNPTEEAPAESESENAQEGEEDIMQGSVSVPE